MLNMNDPNDLQKAATGLGSYFSKQAAELEKSYSFHKGLGEHHKHSSEHHEQMSKSHNAHAALAKAHHDGLADDHEMKAHLSATHELHRALGEHHKATSEHHAAIAKAHADHAEAMKTEIDAMKSIASDWGASPAATSVTKAAGSTTTSSGASINLPENATLNERISFVTDAMMAKAMDMVNNDPTVATKLQHIVLERIGEQLGSKIVPDQIRGAIPSNVPGAGVTAVPRNGQPDLAVNMRDVPPEFEQFLKIEG